jgi:hypothetical protein
MPDKSLAKCNHIAFAMEHSCFIRSHKQVVAWWFRAAAIHERRRRTRLLNDQALRLRALPFTPSRFMKSSDAAATSNPSSGELRGAGIFPKSPVATEAGNEAANSSPRIRTLPVSDFGRINKTNWYRACGSATQN